MKFLFLSTHAFLPTTRKTSVHFVSEALAARGHAVETISVGFSHLSYFKKKTLYRQLSADQRNRFVETAPRYRSACYLPPIHPFSTGNSAADALMAPLFALYGNILPRFMTDAIRAADVIVVESGTSIAFFDAIRRTNPRAQTVYFVRDQLATIGASAYLQRLEQRIAPLFGRIIVPSQAIAGRFAASAAVFLIPQGIDKQAFDRCTQSPYPAGTVNAVAVGNMLFDRAAVAAMAENGPEIAFHLFGEGIPNDLPPNVRVYGERPFAEIIAYIKFADFGLAPYRLHAEELYLVESSLKLRQYSYCCLPILAPELMASALPNIIGYARHGETGWPARLAEATAMRHDPAWKDGILSWDDVACLFETAIRQA